MVEELTGLAYPWEMSPLNQVYDAALAYLRAGWSPTPLVSKVPVLDQWPTVRLSEADAYSYWAEGTYSGIGIVCGAPSGNLLVIDVEGRLAGDSERLAAIYAAAVGLGVGDLLSSAIQDASASTPSGGRHLFLRCTDGPVPGNVKLCYASVDGKNSLLAETRGAGGQVAAWPAEGREWLGNAGPGSCIPVTSVQLGLLLDAFRSIDEASRLPSPTQRAASATFEQPRSLTVAQALNDALMAGEMTWADVLDPGWTLSGYDRVHGYSLWLRPDYGSKSTALSSAHGFESAKDPRPVFVVHSASVTHLPTGEGQRLTPGRVLAYCSFEGNEAAAYAALETAVKGGEVHPAVARIPVAALQRVVEVVVAKMPKPAEQPALSAPAPAATALEQPSGVVHPEAINSVGGTTPEGDAKRRTSWWPVDLTDAISGQWSDPPPEILHRQDGVAIFYPGKVNGLIGESESGKTWVALAAVRELLMAAALVLYVDFEDGARGIVGRLRAMGVPDHLMLNLRYIRPDESFSSDAATDLGEVLDREVFSMVVIDGVNAAFSLMGFDINSNNDASAFYQRLLVPIAKRGPGVVTIDHVPKNADARGKGGIGAGAKRGMGDGTFVRVEALEPFGRGQTGRLRLTVDKDRPGQVREVAQEAKFLGIVELISNRETGAVAFVFHTPDTQSGPFRPTVIMERVSHALAKMPEGASKRMIETTVSGRAETVRTAIDMLQDEGYIEIVPGPRSGQILLKLAKPFSALELPEPEMDAIARRYGADDD